MIPGVNILNMALSLIQPVTVQYLPFLDRTSNEIGLEVSTYDTPMPLKGSFQPVPLRLFQQYGLDLNKIYYNFYAPANMLELNRLKSGDKLQFNGMEYEVIESGKWYQFDGWNGIMCVEIGAIQDD